MAASLAYLFRILGWADTLGEKKRNFSRSYFDCLTAKHFSRQQLAAGRRGKKMVNLIF